MKKITEIDEIKRWTGGLEPSHECCLYCGKGKFDYIDRDTGVLTPLNCECEKYFNHLQEAKEGIIQTQNRVREKVNFNDNKLFGDDRRYMIDSEKMLSKTNQSILDMANHKSRREWEINNNPGG